MTIINTKADLDALRGTEAYAEALRRILGAVTMWVNDAPAGQAPMWRQESVGDTLARLDLTIEELLAECAAFGICLSPAQSPSSAMAAVHEEAVASQPKIVAAAMSVTIDGGDVSALDGAFNIAAALYLGPGQFMLLLYNPLPDANYYVVAQGDLVACQPVERAPDYFTLETRNGSGDLADPSRLCVQVYKVG